MTSKYPTCIRCGKSNNTVTLQPSVSQMLFGGFNGRMVYRCAKCDKRVARNLKGIFNNVG